MPNTKSPVAVFDLTAAERDAVEPVLGVGDDVVGIVVAREQVGVRHPHHRQVLIRLAATVAAARATLLARARTRSHM